MADGESRKYWMYAQVEEDDRDAMMMIAGHEGKHITKVVELAIQEFIANWIDDEDNPDDPDVKLRRIAFDTRRKQNRFVMLKQLAYAYNDEQTDDAYEMLQKACDLAKVDIEIVLETINKTAQGLESKVIDQNAHGILGAEMWLEENVIEPGKMMAVAKIRALTEERGFKWHTVQKAKARRNIQSIKDGTSWYWIRSPSDDPLPEDQVPGDDLF
jgi:hypothetical protein